MQSIARTAMAVLFCITTAMAWASSDNHNNGTGTASENGNLNGSSQLAERARKALEDPLGGIVVNRTMTVQGQDFYRFFSSWWREIDEEGRYTISIHERPSARWGSEVWVQFRRDRVFHMFLPPARSRTRDISKEAVEIAYENITRNELQRAVFQSEDLGPEEM